MPDYLEGFDEVSGSKFEDRNYLNQFPGIHELTITKFELSKTGRAAVAEFKDRDGKEFTNVFKLDTDEEWKRERSIRELRQLAGAARNVNPATIKRATLFEGVVGGDVKAIVAANKNGFFIVKFESA